MNRVHCLAGVLDLLRVRGALMARLHARAPWGFRISAAPGATFHAVIDGRCWVRLPGHQPRELAAGDGVLVLSGAAHVIASDRTGPTRPFDRAAKARARNTAGEIVIDGAAEPTRLLCAAYEYDHDAAHSLMPLLPPLLVVRPSEVPDDDALSSTLRLLGHELANRSPGSATIIDRLIDIVFAHVIRAWVENPENDASSWLMALRDPVIARALTAMHTHPSAPWTIERLAREVNLSRATLTRRFSALVGEPPLAYLTRWRMDLAARHLRDTDDSVSAIARRVGYASEFAFSRAFSRLRGQAPGRYRAQARLQAGSQMRSIPATPRRTRQLDAVSIAAPG
jgi:AraC-like DNA-binding protein